MFLVGQQACHSCAQVCIILHLHMLHINLLDICHFGRFSQRDRDNTPRDFLNK